MRIIPLQFLLDHAESLLMGAEFPDSKHSKRRIATSTAVWYLVRYIQRLIHAAPTMENSRSCEDESKAYRRWRGWAAPAISITEMDPDDAAGTSRDPLARHEALVSCRPQGCEARHSFGYLNIGTAWSRASEMVLATVLQGGR
jgi:hypothetical protein